MRISWRRPGPPGCRPRTRDRTVEPVPGSSDPDDAPGVRIEITGPWAPHFYGTFAFFALASFFFVLYEVPETKQQELESMTGDTHRRRPNATPRTAA